MRVHQWLGFTPAHRVWTSLTLIITTRDEKEKMKHRTTSYSSLEEEEEQSLVTYYMPGSFQTSVHLNLTITLQSQYYHHNHFTVKNRLRKVKQHVQCHRDRLQSLCEEEAESTFFPPPQCKQIGWLDQSQPSLTFWRSCFRLRCWEDKTSSRPHHLISFPQLRIS